MDSSNKNKTEKFILYLIKGITILLPLFFLPFGENTGIDNYNKQYLLWVVIPLLLFLYFFNSIRRGRFIMRVSIFSWPIIFFIAISALSSIFSLDRFTSTFGAHGNPVMPLMTLVALALWFQLIVQVIDHKRDIFGILKYLLFGYFLLLFFVSLYIFGVFNENGFIVKLIGLSQGGTEELALYISILAVFISSMMINIPKNEIVFFKKEKLFFKILFLLSFILLVSLNFIPAWVCFAAGVISAWLLPKAACIKKEKTSLVGKIGIAIMGLVVVLLFTSHFMVYEKIVPEERSYQKYQLDQANTLKLAFRGIADRSLLGTGPDTFRYAFSSYRDSAMNMSKYWKLRFNSSYPHILEIIITTGVLGFFSYLGLITVMFIFIYRLWRRYMRTAKTDDTVWTGIGISITSVLIALILIQFLYSTNTNLLFLFWLFAALIMLFGYLTNGKNLNEYVLVKESNPRMFASLPVVGFVWLTLSVTLLSLSFKYYAGELKYVQARAGSNEATNYQNAINLNPYRSQYPIKLAKYRLERALNELKKDDGDVNMIMVENLINESLEAAKQAIMSNPESVAAHETMGMVYRRISSFSEGSNEKAIVAFKKASELEPSNPVLYTELAEIHMDLNNYNEAAVDFKKASELKPDYYRARIGLAKAYIEGDEYDEALTVLNKLAKETPTAEILYQKGRAYFNKKSYSEAASSFRTVLSISPNHANAIYSLGLALEEEGKIEQALYFFKKAKDLNPDNLELAEKINKIEQLE